MPGVGAEQDANGSQENGVFCTSSGKVLSVYLFLHFVVAVMGVFLYDSDMPVPICLFLTSILLCVLHCLSSASHFFHSNSFFIDGGWTLS